MSPDTLFSIVNNIALLSWLALITRPRHAWVMRWCGTMAPMGFALVYVTLIAMRFGRTRGGFDSLVGVAALFQDPWILLAGWVHYLAFDLLVGVWEVRDAESHGVTRGRLMICLVLTFLFGPAGWLLYRVLRPATVGARTAG